MVFILLKDSKQFGHATDPDEDLLISACLPQQKPGCNDQICSLKKDRDFAETGEFLQAANNWRSKSYISRLKKEALGKWAIGQPRRFKTVRFRKLLGGDEGRVRYSRARWLFLSQRCVFLSRKITRVLQPSGGWHGPHYRRSISRTPDPNSWLERRWRHRIASKKTCHFAPNFNHMCC